MLRAVHIAVFWLNLAGIESWSWFLPLEAICTEKCRDAGKPYGRLLGTTCSCYCPVLNPPEDNDPCEDSEGPSCQRFCQFQGYSGGDCIAGGYCWCFCRVKDPYELQTTTVATTTSDPSLTNGTTVAPNGTEPTTTSNSTTVSDGPTPVSLESIGGEGDEDSVTFGGTGEPTANTSGNLGTPPCTLTTSNSTSPQIPVLAPNTTTTGEIPPICHSPTGNATETRPSAPVPSLSSQQTTTGNDSSMLSDLLSSTASTPCPIPPEDDLSNSQIPGTEVLLSENESWTGSGQVGEWGWGPLVIGMSNSSVSPGIESHTLTWSWNPYKFLSYVRNSFMF